MSRVSTEKPDVSAGQGTRLERQATHRWRAADGTDLAQWLIATAGTLLIAPLYLLLPDRFQLGPSWLFPALEVALIAPTFVSLALFGRKPPYRVVRGLALGMIVVLLALLLGALTVLVHDLLYTNLSGGKILKPAALIWAINILVFGVWFWEIDGGGPHARHMATHQVADLLFPQQQNGNPTNWAPGFIDYVFVAFCFATAFSPADTSPLTQRAKLLMMAEAVISLVVVALVVARSVNII